MYSPSRSAGRAGVQPETKRFMTVSGHIYSRTITNPLRTRYNLQVLGLGINSRHYLRARARVARRAAAGCGEHGAVMALFRTRFARMLNALHELFDTPGHLC
eukprot:6409181-Prymnesium_polylepis.1